MMSEVLAEDVHIEVVQRLWNKEFESLDDTRQVADLICRLYQTYVTGSASSMAEKKAIRRDAAKRLLDLVRQQIHDVRVWDVLGMACRLHLWSLAERQRGDWVV